MSTGLYTVYNWNRCKILAMIVCMGSLHMDDQLSYLIVKIFPTIVCMGIFLCVFLETEPDGLCETEHLKYLRPHL